MLLTCIKAESLQLTQMIMPDFMNLIQKPTHQEFIWVKSAHGNESKTWFQK